VAERVEALRSAEFWKRLLKLVDSELDERHELVIVGGAAIGLRYADKHLTSDIDAVTTTKDKKLWTAVLRACAAMQEAEGLPRRPVFTHLSIFDAPEDWEERQRTLQLGLKRLVVRVPERHDLAISKVSRGLGRDYAALKAVHEVSPFRLKTLVERYREATRVRVGDPRRFKENLLVLIAELFGDEAADRVEAELE
jgi:hypothetical protein